VGGDKDFDEVQEIDAGIEEPSQTLGEALKGGADFLAKNPSLLTNPLSAAQRHIPVQEKGNFLFSDDPLADAKPEAPSTGQVLLGGISGSSPDPNDYASQPGWEEAGKGAGGISGQIAGTIGPGVPDNIKRQALRISRKLLATRASIIRPGQTPLA
jgi:hypothetical protein